MIYTASHFQCRNTGHPWWRHQMETISALLAICAGNSPVTGEFSTQRPVTRSFDIFFDLRLNKRLSKLWWGLWVETPSRPLWRCCNASKPTWTVTELIRHLGIAISWICMCTCMYISIKNRRLSPWDPIHCRDAIMSAMAFQITGVPIVCWGADQRKHHNSLPLPFVKLIHRSPADYPHKGPVTLKIFPFDDVIMKACVLKTFSDSFCRRAYAIYEALVWTYLPKEIICKLCADRYTRFQARLKCSSFR